MPEQSNRLVKFWNELKRRKVIHVIVVYATVSFVIIELINNVFEPLRLPEWTPTLVIIILLIGFPFAILFSWIFDVSKKGIKRTESIKAELANQKESHSSPEKSIIVLPFENISPDPDQEYFSDGLTEEIITDLSHIHDLLVISRNSAMTFKGTKKKTDDIAREVNVRYVLEGSVRKEENKIRITAQLIDASNDSHLWAEKYNENMDSILEIQENVSRSIAEALKVKLSPIEDKKLSDRPIDNPLVKDCYLKARYELMRFTEESIKRALSALQNGLDFVGDNALIYSGMGFAHWQFVNIGIKQDEHLNKAEEYAEKALKLDPDSAEAHLTYSAVYALKGNPRKTIYHIKQALLNNPNDTDILIIAAWIFTTFGKIPEALPLVEQALKIDPINPNNFLIHGAITCFEGRFELATERCEKAYQIRSDVPIIDFWYALCLAYNKKNDAAISIIDQSLKSPAQDIWTQLSHFLKLALQGDKEGIQELLTEQFLETTKRDFQYSYHIATYYSLLNQIDLAMEWLEHAINRGFINYPLINKIDPFLENLRGEKRFRKLVAKAKYEWENIDI